MVYAFYGTYRWTLYYTVLSLRKTVTLRPEKRDPSMEQTFDGDPAAGQNLTYCYLTESPSDAQNLRRTIPLPGSAGRGV